MDESIRPTKASDWLLALLERPEDDLLQRRFAAWLMADSENSREWDEVFRTYEVLGLTVPAHHERWARYPSETPAARAMPEFSGQGAPRRRSRFGDAIRPGTLTPWRRALGIAAAAIAACLALFVLPSIVLEIEADVVTETGEIRRVELSDGSIIRLGPQSAIATAYSASARDVRLLKGVAYFDVVPDASRPFQVEAHHMRATALGTTFEVRMNSAGAAVAVREGVVKVEDQHDGHHVSEVLRVGDWVRVLADGGSVRGTLPQDHIASWIDGRLIVADRTVGDVVDELRRYYPGMVILRGDALARQPLTGVYGLSDPASAIRAIAGAQGVSVYQLSPWVLVVSGG